jgi:hypothetical protein
MEFSNPCPKPRKFPGKKTAFHTRRIVKANPEENYSIKQFSERVIMAIISYHDHLKYKTGD